MRWQVALTPAAERDFKKLDRTVQRRVLASLELLAETPLPLGVKRLVGLEATYRIRLGDYRLLYRLEEATVVVVVIKIAHRREVYR